MKILLFLACIPLYFLLACGNSSTQKSRKLRNSASEIKTTKIAYDFAAQGIPCDSVLLSVSITGGKEKLIVSKGIIPFDTITILDNRLKPNEKDILKMDMNFDNFCDIIIPDKQQIKNDAIHYFYFVFDKESKKFMKDNSLPAFIGGIKLDIKNQRVKLYCPDQQCFAYYKYTIDKKFEKVQGEFK